MAQGTSFCDSVIRHVDRAADLIGLDANVRRIIAGTVNEITVNFPVRMEDGRVEMFTGFRIQHNDLMGPFEGGVRFHPALNIGEVRALAACSTWKAAIVNVPFGGASGGIQFSPSRHTTRELEHITRRFTFALGSNIGPEYDILAPDVSTNAQIMAWILDTYVSTVPPRKRQASIHVVTGKPIKSGGSLGRDKATGQGIVFLIQQWAGEKGFALDGATYMVQGFGNVGSWTARLLKAQGARMVAAEDFTGAIANTEGIDPDELLEHLRRSRGISGFPKAKPIDHRMFLNTQADVFIPAALEHQITGETASLLNVKLVAEGANSPTDPDADQLLKDKGIDIIPDILCNSGGLVVSYFEWLQNKRSEFWDLEEVDAKLRRRMVGAYQLVSQKSREMNLDWRISAYVVALERIQKVYLRRGIFP